MTSWSVTFGDNSFAWTFSLFDATDHEVVGPATALSWGSFALVLNGVNVCQTAQEGETVDAAHWFLRPVAEWLVRNWNPLFHETRLPVSRSETAASADEVALAYLDDDRLPGGVTWGLPASGLDGRMDRHQEWADRHRLTAAAPQAPLPDLWLRRVDGDLEVSSVARARPLFDEHVRWSAFAPLARLPVEQAAGTIRSALTALLDELVRRDDSDAYSLLRQRFQEVLSTGQDDVRLAWLIGLQGDADELAHLRDDIEAIDPHVAHLAGGAGVLPRTPVGTLFGSMSPEVQRDDLRALLEMLAEARQQTGLPDRLGALVEGLDFHRQPWMTDGEFGSELGDRTAPHLPTTDGRVLVAEFLEDAGIQVSSVDLTDQSLRAVTLLHADGRCVIGLNTAYERGKAFHVTRFSLAHELAHLLFHRDRAGTLALASGPWTQPEVERVANAFAAALLMPDAMLRAASTGWETPVPTPDDVRLMAANLGVGIRTLVQRLCNMGMLSREAADQLIDEMLGEIASF